MKESLFEIGDKLPPGFQQFFKGTVNLNMLVDYSTQWNCPIGYVTFQKGARNNWHRHPGGQILIVIDGKGWYVEENKDPIMLAKGVVITVPKNARHWHGASADSALSHISIETNITDGAVVWEEAVSDEEYDKLNNK